MSAGPPGDADADAIVAAPAAPPRHPVGMNRPSAYAAVVVTSRAWRRRPGAPRPEVLHALPDLVTAA